MIIESLSNSFTGFGNGPDIEIIIKARGSMKEFDDLCDDYRCNKAVSFVEVDALCHFSQDVRPHKVIFNDPATIVLWNDGTKTVVKCQEGDTYDKEKGLALCIAKKALGNKGNFNNEFKKWLEE